MESYRRFSVCSSWEHLLITRSSLLALVMMFAAFAAEAQSPPTIVKAFGTATVPLNGSTTLTFTITNPNPATDLTNVSFTDNLPAGLIIGNPDSLVPDPVLGNCDPTGTTGVITPAVTNISLTGGQIPANATCTFSVDVLAVSGGDQVNTTDPISSTEGGTGGTATATVSVVLPDLTVTKTHAGDFRQNQIGATYSITVTNSGGAGTTPEPVTVTDVLPAGLTATDISGVGWTCTIPPVLKCTRPDALDAGLSFPDIIVTVNVAPNAPASVTNQATVAGGGEANTANDAASDVTNVVPVSDVTITKSHAGNLTPGQTNATYTLTVSNLGPGPTAGLITVTDTLPNVPNTLVATGISGLGWSCNLATLSCTRSDVLAANASYPTITVTVNVPSNIQPNVTNTATVSGGGELNTANNTATDPTHIGVPLQIVAQVQNLQVTRGGTTSTTFNVDSSNGLGAITFSCSGLPAGATCAFNPSSTTTLSTQVTMTVTVAAAKGSALPPRLGNPPPGSPTWLLLLGLAVISAALWRNKRVRVRVAAGLVSLALILPLAGCGGSNKSGTGSFPITVTATSASTGTSATTTVNLQVN